MSFTCVVQSYPQSSPNLLFSQVILPQKCSFCSSFFSVTHNSLTKAHKNILKSPKFFILHEDVPFHTQTLLGQLLLHYVWQRVWISAPPFMMPFSIPSDSVSLPLMRVRKYTIAISQLCIKSFRLFSSIQRAKNLLTMAKSTKNAVFLSVTLCQSKRTHSLNYFDYLSTFVCACVLLLQMHAIAKERVDK